MESRRPTRREKVNAPTFAYRTVYGSDPPLQLRGRTDEPKKMWKGLEVDAGLKVKWLDRLNSLPVSIRSTDEGKGPERPAFVIFRMPEGEDRLYKKMVRALKKYPGLRVKADMGMGGRPRICVAGKVWKEKPTWEHWWETLPGKIEGAYNEALSGLMKMGTENKPQEESMNEHFYFFEDEGVECPHCGTENSFDALPIYEDEGEDYIVCEGCGEELSLELDEVSKERKMELYKQARKEHAKLSGDISRRGGQMKMLSQLSKIVPRGEERKQAMGHTYKKVLRWPTISKYKKLLSKEPGVDVKTLYSPKKTRPSREWLIGKGVEQTKKTAAKYGF